MIRPYNHSDFEMICSWWDSHNEPAPVIGMMIENGTFIYEHENKPILSLTVFLTQSTICYFEGYISSPEITKEVRNECGIELWNYCFDYAEKNNSKHVIAYTDKPSLVKRYEALGMHKSIDNLTALIRSTGV